MELDIVELGKSVSQIATSVAKVIPIVRDWGSNNDPTPKQIQTVQAIFDDIREGVSSQKMVALIFRPQIENYSNVSQMVQLLEKMTELANENKHVIDSTTEEIAPHVRRAFNIYIGDLREYDITILKRICSGDYRFIGEKDKKTLQTASRKLQAELAAAKRITEMDNWEMDQFVSHVKEMHLAAIDIKAEIAGNINTLIDTLAFSKS